MHKQVSKNLLNVNVQSVQHVNCELHFIALILRTQCLLCALKGYQEVTALSCVVPCASDDDDPCVKA